MVFTEQGVAMTSSILNSREEIMRISQIVISPEIKFSKQVRVFTEQGVAMLSGPQKENRFPSQGKASRVWPERHSVK